MNRILFSLLLLTSPVTALPLLAGQPAKLPYPDAIAAAIKEQNHQKVMDICEEWHQSGTVSAGMRNWNYNALMSLEPDALLIVQNDIESYHLWMVQTTMETRKNVTVISLESLGNPVYRSFITGWKKVRFKGVSSKEIMRNLLIGDNMPVYLGIMLEKSIIEQEKNNLYLTGLALKFSETALDNLGTLKEHYEQDFLLDELRQDLSPEPRQENIVEMNLNYLPAFLLLYRYYADHSDAEEAGKLRDMSLRIAKAGNKEQEVNSFFSTQMVIKPGNITVKSIEKTMKKVNDKLWAAEVETTNEQYERFLTSVLKNKDYDLLNLCKSLKTNWRDLLPDSLKVLDDTVLFQFGHPDESQMPVQQITHEAAQHYCTWLTTSYNASGEKKKFKKVVFRLPDEQEWMLAARCGRDQYTPYPWGAYFVRNSKGCYLLNVNVTKPCPDCLLKGGANDGGYFPVAAATYYPNDFGLYNMSGNVAEMIQEPGKAKGGSWQDDAYHAQISQVKTYISPSPAIGFRVFMEVIEE